MSKLSAVKNARKACYIRQYGICCLCEFTNVISGDDNPFAASLEHVIPVSRGGQLYSNVAASHIICNNL